MLVIIYILYIILLKTLILLSNYQRGPNDAIRRSTHAPGQSRMRRAWNHALSQARARRRRRWGVLFFWRLRLWTLAGTFPVPYFKFQG